MAGGAGNVNAPRFERLAQGFQHLAIEFGQLVEKQDSLVRQADLARARRVAAADQRNRRCSVVRLAVGAQGEGFRLKLADQRQDGGRRLGGGAVQIGHQAGQAGSEHGLAGTRRADHEQ